MDGERRALIVANDEYEHAGLRRLRAPAADAEALAGVLSDPAIGHFEVRAVHNEPAHEIQERIEELFSEARADDVLLLHFSCHGLKSEAGDLFFAARNTRPNRLGSTAVSAEFVQRCMRMSRSRSIVLLLDCCYGGAFGEGVSVRASGAVNVLDAFPGGRLGGGRGRAVITASSAMEYAFEGGDLADEHQQRPSVFTSALVEGLRSGEADRDEDGLVSLNELYEYVFDRVREQNPNQTPSRDVEMQGELYLARSQRRRIAPLPVPADVRAAVADDNMYTRLGGVSELRTRVNGDNVAAAMGAHTLLTEIAQGDIRYVADAAHAALRDVQLQVADERLDFGVVPLGGEAPTRTLHVGGPPLARACTFQVSEPWLHARPTPEGAEVSVRPASVGPLRAQVTVTAPTGQAVVEVTGEVVPAVGAAPRTAASSPAAATPVLDEALAAERTEGDTSTMTAASPMSQQPVSPPPPATAGLADAGESTEAPAPALRIDSSAAAVEGVAWPRLALVCGVLLLVSLVLPYRWGEPITAFDDSISTYSAAWLEWAVVGLTALVAAVMGLARRPNAWVAAGVVVGLLPLALWRALTELAWTSTDELGIGFWLGVVAYLLLVLTAVVTLRALLGSGVLMWSRPGANWLTWVYAALAIIGTAVGLASLAEIWSTYYFAGRTAVVVVPAAVVLPMAAACLTPRGRALPVVTGLALATLVVLARYGAMLRAMGGDSDIDDLFGLVMWVLAGTLVVAVAAAVADSRRRAASPAPSR